MTDYAVGSPQDMFWDPGRVTIVSGASGTVLRQIHGLAIGASFGYSLAAIGDIDADGYVDVLVTAPAHQWTTHEKRVFSARTGATLWTANLFTWWNYKSTHVDGGADVDGDAVSDFAADGFWNNTDKSIQVFSGATHAVVHDIGLAGQDSVVGPFAMMGDLDGDQRSEIAYTAVGAGGIRVVHVVSGATAGVLRTFTPAPSVSSSCLDQSLVRLGDVDGDGTPDFAVTERCSARVFVVSGATAQLIRTHSEPALGMSYGEALAGVGDLDHDGVADLLVGAPAENSVAAYSGRTGVLLITRTGPHKYGAALAAAGDVDGDGFADFAVGAPGAFSPSYFGSVTLVSPVPLPPRAVGTPQVNGAGCSPVMQWTGFASATSTAPFTITATLVVNQKTGTFVYGIGDPVSLPFHGGTMSVPGPRRRTGYVSSGGNAGGYDCSGSRVASARGRLRRGTRLRQGFPFRRSDIPPVPGARASRCRRAAAHRAPRVAPQCPRRADALPGRRALLDCALQKPASGTVMPQITRSPPSPRHAATAERADPTAAASSRSHRGCPRRRASRSVWRSASATSAQATSG
ncbi:MAG: FG-GAP repeat protein [Sandaracinaceae bacterium]|nr:FG-GAP repeat protein [Sandaracinaceae bacterium]